MSRASSPDGRRHGCPICGSTAAVPHTPFCSRRCRDRDLLNWLGDAYRVPGPPAGDGNPESSLDGLDSEPGPPL